MAKILLVDDDLQLTIMLKMLLEGEKYDVQVCNRGLDAQEALEAQFFDVIVLDWELPDTSGPEICRVFRERGGTEPILMLTTRSAPSVEEVSLDSGADDYLVKPFDPRELFARLKALLRSTTVPAPPPRKTSAQGLANPPDIDAAFRTED